MDRIVGCCGLVCTDCPAYIATQADDDAMRERVAQQWVKQFGGNITKDDINCDGCTATSGRVYAYCSDCGIRACTTKRELANCGSCSEYGCEQLQGFFKVAPGAKETLDGLRAKR
ncbi:MAG: DUF3795 domain-containing protein [Clostridia bacterium]|nr:DUF3795 domain-containing protein [Clostridia bacterium]